MTSRSFVLIALALCAITAVFFLPPISQDPGYHNFADNRTLLGIPNFWNVLSNLPFLILGCSDWAWVCLLSLESIERYFGLGQNTHDDHLYVLLLHRHQSLY
jgi:hypothetical protein